MSFLTLDRWVGLGQVLFAVPRCEALGLGNLLARRRILQLDYRPVAPRADHDQRSFRRPAPSPAAKHSLDLYLWSPVGTGRSDFRIDHALSRHVPRHGRCSGIHPSVWHANAADLSR